MEPSVTGYTELLYPLIIGAGLFSGLRLLSQTKGALRVANALLIVLLVVLVQPMWNAYVSTTLGSSTLQLGGFFNKSYWLLGPLLYLFIKEVFTGCVNRTRYALHFLPIIAFPLFEEVSPFNTWTHFKIDIALWALLTSGYCVFIFRSLANTRKLYQQTRSEALAQEFIWCLTLVVGLLSFLSVDILLGLYIIIDQHYPESLMTLFLTIRALFAIGVITYTLYRRLELKAPLELQETESVSILASNTSPQDRTATHHDAVNSKSNPQTNDRKDARRLTDSAAQQLITTLEQHMIDKHWFTDPKLKLSDLASQLGVSTHELSEVFNVHMHTNFYQYVNAHRIAFAQKLLMDSPNTSITDVAYQCGYGSKASFYDNFKKICNVTPVKFREATSTQSA